MMIYAVIKDENNRENDHLFFSWEEYNIATFNPELETICLIELGRLKGKTYQDRKKDIEQKAIELSNNRYGGLSYGEEAEIANYFEIYGKRYGLLTDFRENAIC